MKIAVSGITGKMGRAVSSLIIQDTIAEISGGLVREGSGLEGLDLGEYLGYNKNNVLITANIDNFVKSCDAIIDFSSPSLSLEIAKKSAEYKKVLVSGTTGFSDDEKQQFVNYAKETPIIWSSNMSVGVNLLLNLVEKVSSILRDDYDVEILEMHHNKKIDAPSGTSLSLGSAVASGRNIDLKKHGVMSRFGKDAKRQKGEIGFATLRGGDVIGDHTVIFATEGERLELAHKASNRDIFAKGAIRACIWGSSKQAGFYSMRDVLN